MMTRVRYIARRMKMEIRESQLDDTGSHGLRMPNETFFHRNPKLLGLGTQFGQINSGAFGVFLADISAPILVL
jgi:hypothetical protein